MKEILEILLIDRTTNNNLTSCKNKKLKRCALLEYTKCCNEFEWRK